MQLSYPGRKVRFDGNSDELIELAKVNAMALGAGEGQW
jgi:adenosine/AMP kinase